MKLYSGDTFEHAGATYRVTLEHDDSHGAPWEECDGHGVVSGWERGYCDTPRDCWVLVSDRGGKRFYNWRETLAIAKRDGWGLAPDALAKLAKQLGREPSARDIRKAAVRADFDYLSGWANDQWSYVGVIVELMDEDNEPTGESESLWGVESYCSEYIAEVALELAGQIADVMGEHKDDAMALAG